MLGSGGGWEYSCSGSLHFNASISNFSGRNGNLFVIACIFGGSLFCWMKLYKSLCIVLGGLMIFWFVWMNGVYGCVVMMCLSSGFCNSVIRSRIFVVQSGTGFVASR